MTSNSPGRGRPKLHSDEQILEAALRMFATHGYDGMSLRSLNRELGLSHSHHPHTLELFDAFHNTWKAVKVSPLQQQSVLVAAAAAAGAAAPQ